MTANTPSSDDRHQGSIAAEPNATADAAPSGVVRNLGLIKAMAVIMAVLIVAALVTIVVTIYSRLQAADEARSAREIELIVPADASIHSAAADKSGMILVLDTKDGQQIWRLTGAGRVTQKITVKHTVKHTAE